MAGSDLPFLVLVHRIIAGGVVKKGGVDYLLSYFNKAGRRFCLIEHPLIDWRQPTRVSDEVGRLLFSHRSFLPLTLRFVFELVDNLWAVLKLGRRYRFILAVDPLTFLSADLIKFLGFGPKTVFHSVDYSEKRFSSPLLNRLYDVLYRRAVRRADLVSYVSRPMGEKIKSLLPAGDSFSKTFYLPNSPEFSSVPRIDPALKNPHSLIYSKTRLSARELTGLLGALDLVWEKFPRMEIKLTGLIEEGFDIINYIKGRPYLSHLGLLSYEANLKVVSQAAVGIAWYENLLSFEKYVDSLKIREYAACGLVTVVNEGISTALELEKEKAGLVVKDFSELSASLLWLFSNPQNYQDLRQKALTWARKVDKTKLMEELEARLP